MATPTSITQAKLTAFLKTAKEREQLGCDKIKGFFFVKLKTGGAWRLRYTDVTGKRRTYTIGDISLKPIEAAEIALEKQPSIKDGKDPLAERKRLANEQKQEQQESEAKQYLNTGVYFEQIYTPHKEHNSKAGNDTLKGIKRNFAHLFDRDMDKITSADILSWYNKRRKKGIMRTTLVRDFGAFKAMLNYAARSPDTNTQPVLNNNPIKSYVLPQLTNQELEQYEKHTEKLDAQRDIFTQQDKAAITKGLTLFAYKIREQRRSSRKHGKAHLQNLDNEPFAHWFEPFCHIARLTGMRPADIYALKWEYVIYNQFNDQTTLVFTPTKTKRNGKGKKVKFPVTKELNKVINDWRIQCGSPEIGYIFKSERTGTKIDRKAHLSHWKAVKALGEVTESLDFYSFRHNFISELVARGVPVLTIAGLVGHSDGSMIAENYVKHDEQVSAAILENIFGQITQNLQGVNNGC